MNILDKIDSYLNEKASKQDAMKRVIDVIKSTKTDAQLIVAQRMVIKFNDMYPGVMEKMFGSERGMYPTMESMFGKFADVLNDQKKRIKFTQDFEKRFKDIK